MDEKKIKQLSARLSDLFSESQRGYITFSSFLDPAEIFFSKALINQIGAKGLCFLYGGYKDAERKCAFFLPEFYSDIIEDIDDFENVFSVLEGELSEAVKAVKIKGSGYRKLSHRDFLGALLNMGIERSAIGDLCITEDNTCVLFANASVASLVLTGCERIGSDKVKTEEIPLSGNFSFERKTKPISDTVASDRLDCVVSALSSESREKAKTLILSGLVECNYSVSERTDLRVLEGDTVTIRGTGKFIIDSITEETKKGRIRLAARKYI
ncbi:MAG: hypothetical protein IKJ91_10220 [Clostridia bacterium]|nr:hypothetical protein [Clostridia bacterium]